MLSSIILFAALCSLNFYFHTVQGELVKSTSGLCLLCETGCPKYGTSKMKEIVIPMNLNLTSGVELVVEYLETGNETEIFNLYEKIGAAFYIMGSAAMINTGIMDSVAIDEVLDEISDNFDALVDDVNTMTELIGLDTIFYSYESNRFAIMRQAQGLQQLLSITYSENYDAKVEEFISLYKTYNEDLPLNYMYDHALEILTQVSSLTGYFRRVVLDFGKDMLMHLIAGVTTHYAYSKYMCLVINDADSFLVLWNQKLIWVQDMVTELEATCLSKIAETDLKDQLWEIYSSECPYGNNVERAQSTLTAMQDKYEWMQFLVDAYDTPHGPNFSSADEISGYQWARIGDITIRVAVIYWNRLHQYDFTDDLFVKNSMLDAGENLTCDGVHDHMRKKGVNGTILCTDWQLNVFNAASNSYMGYHDLFQGKGYKVWVTTLETFNFTMDNIYFNGRTQQMKSSNKSYRTQLNGGTKRLRYGCAATIKPVDTTIVDTTVETSTESTSQTTTTIHIWNSGVHDMKSRSNFFMLVWLAAIVCIFR